MKILVTGATGFVGKHLSLELFKNNFDLVYLLRKNSRAEELVVPGEILYWEDLESKKKQLENLYGVVHLAGENIASKRWSDLRKQRILSSRADTTQKLVDIICTLKNPPPIFLSASAVGIYGDREDNLIDESAPVSEKDFLSQVCIAWEKPISKLPEQVRKIVYRVGVVLGRDGGMIGETLSLFKVGLGSPLGSGKQWMSWVHIDDLVGAILWAFTTPSVSGIYNACAPEPVRNSEFTSSFAKSLRKRAFFSVPKFALRSLLGERSSFLLASTRVVPQKLMKEGFAFRFPTLRGAFEHLLDPVRETELEIFYQWIPRTPEQIFPFFADEKNLEAITPPWLNFKIKNKSSEKIEEKTIINYRLKIRGIPVGWRSQIESWNPPHSFIDRQLKGPYSLWHHTHQLEEMRRGTLMTDTIRYRPPLKTLGNLLTGNWIRRDIRNIFAYRRSVISKLFP